MKKIFIPFLILAAVLFQSCEETQAPIYDGVNGQTLAYFNGASANLEVKINSTGTITVPVGVSSLSTKDRTLQISVDPTSTATPGQYSFSGTATIPANSYTGSFTVTGTDDGLVPSSNFRLILKIDSIDGVSAGTAGKYNIRIFEICPIPATSFVGTYKVEAITPGVFGLSAFGNSNVTLKIGGSSTVRTFDANYLGDARFPRTFTFGLSCNVTTFARFATGVGCAPNPPTLVLGPPSAGNAGTYDPDNDTTFLLNVTDNVDKDCGRADSQTSYRFTKI